jgi:hypothetical protein
MSNKMKVLTVSLDVTGLSEQEISELQFAMEVQSEDFSNAIIINSGTRDLDVDSLEEFSEEESDGNLH